MVGVSGLLLCLASLYLRLFYKASWVVGRISLSIKTKLQKQKLHDEESGAKDEEIERKMEIGQRLGCLEEETKRIALIREKEVALVRKKIDFVNKEFSTSQSVKLPPPAKNPQGDLEKVPKKRRLSSQIQVEEKNDEIRLWWNILRN
ncbi:hypothetical protein YC2023_014201 [Brassica napus]